VLGSRARRASYGTPSCTSAQFAASAGAAPAQVETRGFKDETELKELLGVLVASAGALALFDQPANPPRGSAVVVLRLSPDLEALVPQLRRALRERELASPTD
jgi:hypothetical protein